MDERERRKLIAKLKTARTSEERDRILWYLAGQDKEAQGTARRPLPTGTGRSAAEAAEGKAQSGPPAGKLGGVGSITALLFLFYGLVSIVTAVMKIMQGQMEGDEIKQLVMGGAFLVVGILIYLKAKRAQRKAAEEA